MAFSLYCRYVPGTGILVDATFDGLIFSEAEVERVFAQLTREVSWLPRPVYMVADFDSLAGRNRSDARLWPSHARLPRRDGYLPGRLFG